MLCLERITDVWDSEHVFGKLTKHAIKVVFIGMDGNFFLIT